MANRSARAATVFSPPDSMSMSRYRLVGGTAKNLVPPRNGSSAFSSESSALPPIVCTELRVSSCVRQQRHLKTVMSGSHSGLRQVMYRLVH